MDDWLTSKDSKAMLAALDGGISERKSRLLLVGCARTRWELFERYGLESPILVAERFADGRCTSEQLQSLFDDLYRYFLVDEDGRQMLTWDNKEHERTHGAAFGATFPPAPHHDFGRTASWRFANRFAGSCVLDVIRCIFGNPFRPIALDPAWRTEAVVGLAAGVYADRAFDRLPVLADALEDAGCANADVLAHCRGPGPHARGCWVVDLLLGKA